MDSGRGLYIEGSDFGYVMDGTALYSYFGCSYLSDGNSTYFNVEYLDGVPATIADGVHIDYMYGTSPDWSVDIIGSEGGEIFFVSQEDAGRGISWGGGADGYRAIHQCHLFGAMIDGADTKADVMDIYLDYLYRPVTVTLESAATQVPRGGELAVDITVSSNSPSTVSAFGVVYLTLPSGDLYELVGPTPFQLPAGQTSTITARHTVPGIAPLGDYTYRIYIADASRDIFDTDEFAFEVVP